MTTSVGAITLAQSATRLVLEIMRARSAIRLNALWQDGGVAGRYDALNDTARNYAFFLQALNLSK